VRFGCCSVFVSVQSGDTENYSTDMRDHLLTELYEYLFEDNETVFGVRSLLSGNVSPAALDSSLSKSPAKRRIEPDAM
jgi:hypothetical protein